MIEVITSRIRGLYIVLSCWLIGIFGDIIIIKSLGSLIVFVLEGMTTTKVIKKRSGLEKGRGRALKAVVYFV